MFNSSSNIFKKPSQNIPIKSNNSNVSNQIPFSNSSSRNADESRRNDINGSNNYNINNNNQQTLSNTNNNTNNSNNNIKFTTFMKFKISYRACIRTTFYSL